MDPSTSSKSSDRHNLKGAFGSLRSKVGATPKPIFNKSRSKPRSKGDGIGQEANQEETHLGGEIDGSGKNQDLRGGMKSKRLGPSLR